MKTGTKMSNSIDRIKGYCCEVNQAQWEELVRVAHENGVRSTEYDSWDEIYPVFCIDEEDKTTNGYAEIELAQREGLIHLPFPDFLAKLRCEEWQPKAGDMVEVSNCNDAMWCTREFAAIRKGVYVCWLPAPDDHITASWQYCRPIRPTITRAEAEQQLGKRIID